MTNQESVKRSIANSAIGNLGSNLISLAGFVILARMLTPAEFGMMAAISVLAGISNILVDLGLRDALVQNQTVTERHYGSVFLVHLALGLGFTVLILSMAGQIERLFDLGGLSELVRACAGLFFVNAFSLVPVSRLEKNRQFGSMARVELYSTLFSTALTIVLAWLGYGIWALVLNLYCMGIMRALLAIYLSGWIPKIYFDMTGLTELWRFSRYLFVMQAYNYLTINLDKLLISRYLGADTLGAYRYGDRIAQLPMILVNKIFGRVLFPAFSSYQNNKAKIRYQYLKAIRLVSFASFPVMVGVSMVSGHIVLTLLGDKWSEMINILPMLVMSYLLSSVGVLNTSIYKALGRTKRLLKVSVVLRLNLMLCVIVGIQYGLSGLLVGLIVARYINFLPSLYIAGRLINVTPMDILLNIYRVMICCGVMAFAIYGGGKIFMLVPGSIGSLVTVIIVGIVAYVLASLLVQRKTLSELVALVRPSI